VYSSSGAPVKPGPCPGIPWDEFGCPASAGASLRYTACSDFGQGYDTSMDVRNTRFALLFCVAAAVVGCGGTGGGSPHAGAPAHKDDGKVVDLYNWADYIAPSTAREFEKRTGIKLRVSTFETNETLESRLMTGDSGYDVVVPTAPFLERQIRSGAYQPLDKKRIPNLANLDPQLMARVALNDPGNAHSVIYMWGTYGIGYNVKDVAEALGGPPPDGWALFFDPAYASRLQKCGIGTIDAPAGIIRLVLRYLGRDPNAPSAGDLADAENVLLKIRPFIRTINTTNVIESIANGDICIALGYNGDFVQARNRARDAKNGVRIAFMLPREGSLLWFDMLAIPKNAPHVANALVLINFLMDPHVIADISNYIGFANANAAATPFLDASIASDPIVFPPPDQRRRLFVETEDSPEQARALTRIWEKFKTGQ
jgi:putrescine transport system substrate-binding protein